MTVGPDFLQHQAKQHFYALGGPAKDLRELFLVPSLDFLQHFGPLNELPHLILIQHVLHQ